MQTMTKAFWALWQKGLKPENSVEPYRGRRGPAESLGHREAAAHAASGQGIRSPGVDAVGRRDAAFLIRCWPPPGLPRAMPSAILRALQLSYPVVLWVKKVDQCTPFSSVRRGLSEQDMQGQHYLEHLLSHHMLFQRSHHPHI